MALSPEKSKIGIVGAGTMGAGIALNCLYAGYRVVLQDSFPDAISNAKTYIEKFLAKKKLGERIENILFSDSLDSLAEVDLVIEVIIEDLAIKKDIFKKLEKICNSKIPFATNTSTLSVTAISAGLENPSRLLGVHFFNPAPILPLVEIITTEISNLVLVDEVEEFAKSLGKTVVRVDDTPGFIVNRVARPFYGEALRLLGEGVATHQQIDEIVVSGAGFRMGPFELMDLIGIDINAGAMISMYEQTFHEPRYKPHWIQMQKFASGNLGRKTGRGFYTYPREKHTRDVDKPSKNLKGKKVFIGKGGYDAEILTSIHESEIEQITELSEDENVDYCVIPAGRNQGVKKWVKHYDALLDKSVPIFVQACDTTIAEIASWMNNPQRLVGFDAMFFGGKEITVTKHKSTTNDICEQIENLISSLGKTSLWVDDSPGLVLPRIITMLINEASFAVLEKVATSENIDIAMKLGVNYPKGLLEWGAEIGWEKVLSVLQHLKNEYGEERYRPSRLIRRWAWEERTKN